MHSKQSSMKFTHWNAKSYSENSDLQYKASKELLAEYQFIGNEVVLDIGCGHGRLTNDIAELVPKGKIIGIDNSFSMIELAKKNYNKSNLSFALMDAQGINFPEEKFDVIVSTFCIQWTSNKALVFEGIVKHMHDKTKILLIMPIRNEEMASLRAQLMEKISWQTYFKDYSDLDTPSFVPDQAYKKYAEEFGLDNIRFELQPTSTKFSNVERLRQFLKNINSCLIKLPTDELKDKFTQELVESYLEKHPVNSDGSCEITYIFARLIAQGVTSRLDFDDKIFIK